MLVNVVVKYPGLSLHPGLNLVDSSNGHADLNSVSSAFIMGLAVNRLNMNPLFHQEKYKLSQLIQNVMRSLCP